ncbi:hypothetical protein TNCV_548551 [Trichonephila clavipes]|nr:hypothetical protein TNCV_548551 [Trichonephila clavipes]
MEKRLSIWIDNEIECKMPLSQSTFLIKWQKIGNIEETENDLKSALQWHVGRGSRVACLVTSSNPVPLKTRRVRQRCTLNLSRAETSSRWCGVVVRRGACQLRISRKKKPSLQETLDLLQNLPSESSDALTEDSSDEVKRLNKTQAPLSSQPRRNFFPSIMKKLSSTPPGSRLSQPSHASQQTEKIRRLPHRKPPNMELRIDVFTVPIPTDERLFQRPFQLLLFLLHSENKRFTGTRQF